MRSHRSVLVVILCVVTSFQVSCVAPMKPYVAGSGFKTCSALAGHFDDTSRIELGFGTTLAILGSGMAITGAAVGPAEAELGDDGTLQQPAWYEENRNVLILGGGAIISALGTYLITRGIDGSTAASLSTLALKETDDRVAYNKCAQAFAQYLGEQKEAEQTLLKGLQGIEKESLDKALELRSKELELRKKDIEHIKIQIMHERLKQGKSQCEVDDDCLDGQKCASGTCTGNEDDDNDNGNDGDKTREEEPAPQDEGPEDLPTTTEDPS